MKTVPTEGGHTVYRYTEKRDREKDREGGLDQRLNNVSLEAWRQQNDFIIVRAGTCRCACWLSWQHAVMSAPAHLA